MKLPRLLLGLFFAHTATAADNAFEFAFRASLLLSFDEASGKILRLVDAIPEDRYGWRPMEGVSSVREVLVHVAGTNYALAERLGVKPPDAVDRRKLGELMQTKAEAIRALQHSIRHVRGVLATIPAADLLPETNVFGARAPRLRVALLPVDHAHEHLGQLIAYARANQVVPPWSK
jgi:uncharacterized damage-inducible protein DinB